MASYGSVTFKILFKKHTHTLRNQKPGRQNDGTCCVLINCTKPRSVHNYKCSRARVLQGYVVDERERNVVALSIELWLWPQIDAV